MSKYNASELIQKVKELVAEYPNNVYQEVEGECSIKCQYTKGTTSHGGTGCIMGQAIISLYPELKEKLEMIDRYGATIDSVIRELRFEYGPTQLEYLTYIQKNQDDGKLWGRCL